MEQLVQHQKTINDQLARYGVKFGLPYVVMRKPEPIDTTTLNYNWQVWETNAFSVYTKETDEIDEQSAQQAVAAVLRYLSRVGLLRYHCHSGYLSAVVQENEMTNVLTPAGGIFRRFVEPGQEVEYGQTLGVVLDPFTAEEVAKISCPTSGVIFFALKKPLTTEHEVAFKVIRRLHGGCKKERRTSEKARPGHPGGAFFSAAARPYVPVEAPSLLFYRGMCIIKTI